MAKKNQQDSQQGAGDKDQGDRIPLLGSSIQPSVIDVAEGHQIVLGDLVAAAFEASGLTVEKWNNLPEDEREAMLDLELKEMRAKAENAKEPKVPEGFTRMKGGNCSVGGKEYEANEDGVVIVPEKHVATLCHHGYEVA